MARIKFRMMTLHDHLDPVYLGAVKAPVGMSKGDAEKLIRVVWDEFQKTQPDTDGDFPLVLEENHGFDWIPDDACDIVL